MNPFRCIPQSCLIVFACCTLSQGARSQSSYYVFKLGSDTVGLEQYTRTKSLIEGDIVTLSPRVTLTHFKAQLDPLGRIQAFESENSSPPAADVTSKRILSYENGTVIQEFYRRGQKDTIMSGSFKIAEGSVPHMEYDVAMYEQMLLEALPFPEDSLGIDRFTNGSLKSYIKKIGKNKYKSKTFVYPVYFTTDASNRIISLDATPTTIKVTGDRTSIFDMKRMIDHFVGLQNARGNMGSLSPADTIKTSIRNTDFVITYSRPLKRGRTIFGDVVPWNTVWRTGANFATHFSTSRDLDFGSFTLPAGRYTLWTLPNETGTKLIINKKVNIFGTNYDPAADIIRLDMQTQKLKDIAEKFTIQIAEIPGGIELSLLWDQTKYSILFNPKL